MNILASKKLRYFMMTMKFLNFTKAADYLCITRSPLSKTICELEEVVGGKLFERTYSDLVPTELAHKLHQKCQPIYQSLLETECEFSCRQNAKSIEVIVDITISEIIYQHLKMLLEQNNIANSCIRKEVSIEDIEQVKYSKNKIIISLRALPSTTNINIQKWKVENIVLLQSATKRDTKKKPKLFIWNDNYCEYIKKSVMEICKKNSLELEFYEHNFHILELLYLTSAGEGMLMLPEKMGHFYKLGGINLASTIQWNVSIYIYCNNFFDNVLYARIQELLMTIF